jgi:predicted nucleic acid-binding protein
MLIVEDSMILIHLAVGGVLKETCIMYGKVIIPNAVHNEVVEIGKEARHADAFLVEKLESEKYIQVVGVHEKKLIGELEKYGLRGGELEVVALYFQEKADLIASNDDKVRRLRLILNLDLVSSPEIVFMLVKNGAISKSKAVECLLEFKKIGWFSNHVIDFIIMEVNSFG